MNRQDTALWIAKEGGSIPARTALVERYLYLVGQTRLRQFRGVMGEMAEDLEGEGRLALVRCVDSFDRARGVGFPTHAIGWIWGAMAEWLRRDDWTPRSERRKEKAGEEALIRQIHSLDSVFSQTLADGEDLLTYGDMLVDEGVGPEALALQHLDDMELGAMVDNLPEQAREVIEAFFWGEERLKAIAEGMDRSESRVHQIRDEAVRKLRELFQRRADREARLTDEYEEHGPRP